MTFPEDLTILDDAVLEALSQSVKAKLAEYDVDNDEHIDPMMELSEKLEAVKAEQDARSEAAAAFAAKKAKIKDALADDEKAEDTEEAPDDSETDDTDDDSKTEAATDTPPSPAAADEPKTETVPKEDVEIVAENEPSDTLADATNKARTAAERSAAMQAGTANDGALSITTTTTVSNFHASKAMASQYEGQALDFDALVEGFTTAHHALGTARAVNGETVLATAHLGDDVPTLTGDPMHNYEVLQGVVQETQEAHEGPNGLVASGCPCLPTPVDYSFFRLSRVRREIEQSLPVVRAPQGGMRFVCPPDWSYLKDGVTIKTCEDDCVEGEPVEPYVDKSVVKVPCIDMKECCVSAISRILEFNNLTFRAFPGYVREAIYQMGVYYACCKEQMYIDEIDAMSCAVAPTVQTYDLPRDMFSNVALAAYAYRERHKMAPNAPLTFMVPDVAMKMSYTSMVNSSNLEWGMDPDSKLMAYFRKCNINVVPFSTLPTNATPAQGADLDGEQACDAPLNPWPTEIKGYLFAPGTFVRLDGGTLDLGLVRDSTLNRKNDLQMFAEQWTSICMVGYESIAIPITACNNGVGGGELVVPC